MQRRAVLAGGLSMALPLPLRLHAATDDFADETPRPQAAPVTIQWPTLTLVDGSSVPPSAWAGTPAVVVFWATWCAFCQRHNTHITALQRQLSAAAAPPRLRVLGIAIDGNAALVRRTMAAHGHNFPVATDQAGLRSQFTPRRVVPMTCLVDDRGRLRQCIPGEMSASDVLSLATLRWAAG